MSIVNCCANCEHFEGKKCSVSNQFVDDFNRCDSHKFSDLKYSAPEIEEVYQEYYEYSWIKSKAKFIEAEAVNKFSDLLPADWYKHGHLVYVIDEQQLYRAKHKRKLRKIA